jgi:hypothetical protein
MRLSSNGSTELSLYSPTVVVQAAVVRALVGAAA